MRTLVLVAILQFLAFWHVWRWYALRVFDTSGDEYGLLALGTAALMLWLHRPSRTRGLTRLGLPIALVLLYGLLCRFVPSEIRAAIAFSWLAVMLSLLVGRRFPELAVLGLFLISLPLIPSLQFYLGYPMRLLVAHVTIPILRLGGFAVIREGVCLSWGDRLVSIDAPCSGIRMLWVGGYLLFTLSLLHRLSPFRTITAGLIALLFILAANILRAASLFYLEADILVLPSFAHEAVGIVVFCFLAAAIFLTVRWLHKCQPKSEDNGTAGILEPNAVVREKHALTPGSASLCIVVGIFAGLMPISPQSTGCRVTHAAFPGWPEEWQGRPLTSLDLSDTERRFAEEFPGETGRFTDGYREIIMRWVTVPTRKLHPASDCFRAHGAEIEPLPLHIDEQGRTWGAFKLKQDGHRLLVREQFRDNTGKTWSDVSSWYWSAVLGKTEEPWWGFVVVENLDEKPE